MFHSSIRSFNEEYKVADNILGVDGNSKVFFVDEIEDQRYEILLGDGVLGKEVENNSRVEVSYVTTSGAESNGNPERCLPNRQRPGAPGAWRRRSR